MNMRLRSIVILNVVVLAAVAAFAAGPLVGQGSSKQTALDLQDGDILFQHIGGEQGTALQLATGSHWTHVGIVFREDGNWMVYEAVGPVKRTALNDWIEQGHGEYVAKRWAEAAVKMDAGAVSRLRAAANPYLGRAYDWQFLWSDEKIYCSELVWKMYEDALGVRLCEPKPLKDYDLGSEQVRRAMRERYGSAPPMDEPMVAPATLFECPLLVTVLEH